MDGFLEHIKRKGQKMEQELMRIWPTMAARIDVGRAKAYELVASGQIKAVKLSDKSYRVTPAALQEYVERLKAEAESEAAAQ